MAQGKKGALFQVLVPMVDATDFASIESGITESDFNSGVTKKFYGVNHGGSAATTSGTISKTGSLVHSGVFRITLKTTENNYDRMMIRLNKTGCAEQIITWENVDNDDSDLMSALTVIQSMASDAASAAIQANSRVLLNQSRISDIQSYLVAMSGLDSDVQSAIALANSRILLNQSRISDIASYLVAMSDMISDAQSNIQSQITAGVAVRDSDMSDLRSAIAAGPAATITASDISNIASAVWSERYRVQSLASSFGSLFSVLGTAAIAGASRAAINQSRISDVQSYLVALSDQLSDAHSDLASKVGAVTATIGASDISDIASAVWANTTGAATASRILVNLSRISDAQSAIAVVQSLASDAHSAAAQANSRAVVLQSFASDILSHVTALSDAISDFNSDIRSLITVTGVQLNASSISDLRSAIAAGPTGVLTSSDISDIASAVWANTIGARVDSRVLVNKSMISDVYSLVSNVNSLAASSPTASDLASKVWADATAAAISSRVLLNLSRISDVQSYLVALSATISDVYSQLSDFRSDIHSHMSTTGVGLNASTISDLRSAITAVAISASDMSDIASRVGVVLASDLSDILSRTTQINSRVLLNQSRISDLQSFLSDAHSDLASKIGDVSVTLTASDVSDIASAVVAGLGFDPSDIASAVNVELGSRLSDILSAAQQTNSRVLVNQSAISDIVSALAAGVTLGASSLSDIRSAIAAIAISASDISDIASAVRATVASDLSDILSAAVQTNSRVLLNQSRISDVYSLLSDFQSDFGSRVPKEVANASQLLLSKSVISDAHSAATQANSRALVIQSQASDIYSLLGAVGVGVSGISDIASAVWAYTGAEPTTVVAAAATYGATLDWLRALSRNRITQTATVQSLRNDANNADIASAAVSDDGTTAVRAEWGN